MTSVACGTLGRVGECFGNDVIRADLDRVGHRSLYFDLNCGRNRRAVSQRPPVPGPVHPSTGMPREISCNSLVALAKSDATSARPLLRASNSSGRSSAAARSWRRKETSRCCAPSCRSRSGRRRASLEAATIRAREAISSARDVQAAMEVATRSANSALRYCVSGGNDLAGVEPTTAMPQTRPSTTSGAPATEPSPSSRMRESTESGGAHPVHSARPACPK